MTLKNVVPLPNIPWEDRKTVDGSSQDAPLWRYSGNPVITRDVTTHANSIFNSAVVPWTAGNANPQSQGAQFAGVFRCDDKARDMNIRVGFSKDGFQLNISDKPIDFIKSSPDIPDSDYKYDPRVVFVEDRYYIIWCNGYHGACIGMGYTFDFEKFYQLENPLMQYNRNGVLFPRKIHGNFALLSRPSDSGHTPFGDILYSESPDATFWGKHRHVMSPAGGWQSTKVGAGPAPIETSEGWLLFYHGVLTSCNGYVYSFSACLLDLDQPWKVIARPKPYLIAPREIYECAGDVANVTFPCAALVDGATNRLAIYYGCAYTVTGLVFGKVDEIIDWIKRNKI